MSDTPFQPRALTELEIRVVTKLLSSGAAGAGELLAQVPFAQVVRTWGEGSASVDLEVLPGAVPMSGPAARNFAEGAVTDRNGAPIGELILWVENGMLAGIEYAWYTDEPPRALPDPAQIEIV